jgi:hypothetical protein
MPALKDSEGQPTTEANVIEEGQALLQSYKTQIAMMESWPELSPKEQGKLAEMKGYVAEVEHFSEALVTPEGELDVPAAVTGGAMLLPFPWNLVVGVGGGAFAEWWRGRKKRQSFVKLVEAINRIKAKDTTDGKNFAEALDKVGPELRMEMGETAMRTVDKVRNGKPRRLITIGG